MNLTMFPTESYSKEQRLGQDFSIFCGVGGERGIIVLLLFMLDFGHLLLPDNLGEPKF